MARDDYGDDLVSVDIVVDYGRVVVVVVVMIMLLQSCGLQRRQEGR